ncbi:MAG: trigger factor [Actinomycetota bacterium]|nr:trigger factor [Actinomycetota bacterium]
MKSDAETLGPTRVKLTVEVTFDELKPSLDEAYKQIGRQIQVPGFRKGKVPPAIVDQRLGRGAVLDQAVNDALPKLYVQALQDNDLQPVGRPEVDVTRLADGEELAFTAEVDVRPPIELPEYDGLEVEVAVLEVSDEDVEEQLEALRERFASLSDVERQAADGDFVSIDLSASKDGEPIEAAQATGVSYQVGKGTMIDGLDEALLGMSAGEQSTFRSVLIGGDQSGDEVDIQVIVQGVKEQELPELDDEFAQTASEFDTVDELRTDLRERLTRGKRLEQASQARDAVLERLLTMVDVPLPDALVTADLESRREQITQQLAYAGITQEDYLVQEEQTAEEYEGELEKRVRDAITAQFVLDEVARKEQIGLAEAELAQHITRRAQQAGVTPDEYAKHAVEHDHMSSLVNEVVRGKALALLLQRASVTTTGGERVELATLQPDGTYADPAVDDADNPSDPSDPSDPGDPGDPGDPEGASDSDDTDEAKP